MKRAMAVLLAGATSLAACGADPDRPRLVVSAAASLTEPLSACSRGFEAAAVRLSFAGSDELAAQIRQGVRPDVFAAANLALPERLAAEGLLREPVAFATNELVLAVPAGSAIAGIADLERDGVELAVGAPSVPVGAATRTVLGRLGAGRREAILANVRSNEPDVRGVVGKVARGGADAGFAYATDVRAAEGRLEAIEIPERLRPDVVYGAGLVAGGPNPEAARRYLDGLLDGPCADALTEAGFGRPPRT